MAEKRKKSVQKIVDEGNLPLLKHRKTFAEVFPEIENVKIEVEEKGSGITAANRTRTFSKNEFGEQINCQNSWCQKGGFSIEEILKDMRDNRQTEHSLVKTCIGKETGRGGGRIYRPCSHIFNIRVQIKYQE